ncbi:MAG: hypothetical protein ACC645_21345 [Pirellulales bacterium]
MREIMLNLTDTRQAIHRSVHGSMGERIIAALSAEPETIDEVQAALARFVRPAPEANFFDGWTYGLCEEPWDAGIVVVDLSARLVAGDSTYFRPTSQGRVEYHDGTAATDVWLHYAVPDAWMFSHDMADWQGRADYRRRALQAEPRRDAREVLYGQLCPFLVQQLRSAAGTVDERIRAIHARWLMTARRDLQDRSPRDVLLARREAIDRDLVHQAGYWAKLGECPPGLDRQSAAYRLGSFGTHENILYYELVRYLLDVGFDYLAHNRPGGGDEELALATDYLERRKQDWLHTPQAEELIGHTPAQIIHRERARLPNVDTGDSHAFEDDCPLCQMLDQEDQPIFWYLDGCHLDDEFPFSFHATREAWELEQQEWESIRLAWNEACHEPDDQAIR